MSVKSNYVIGPHKQAPSRGHSVRLNCDWCDKEFTRPLSHYDRFDRHFCSFACRCASNRRIGRSQPGHQPSRREEVKHLLLTALSSKEIAAKMNIHPGTVKFHCAWVFKNEEVQDRIGLMAKLMVPK